MACTVRMKCVVQKYHAFKDEWKPEIGDIIRTMVEETNDYDRYTVKAELLVICHDLLFG